MADGDAEGDPLLCQCGAALESGIALLTPVGYPDERERYEDVALAAAPFARCPQCGEPNEHLELGAVLIFHPGGQVFIQLPPSADDAIVAETRKLASDGLGADWAIEITRDPAAFRKAAIGAVLNLIEQERFIELAPARGRDYAYHSALVTATRPGLLRVESAPDGISEGEIAEMLEEARRLQVAQSFAEAFAEADVALFDPAAEVAELFPPECFEAGTIAALHSWVESEAGEGVDVAAPRAALVAAAVHAGVARPGGLELARDLVRLALSGTVFRQSPETWGALLNAGEIYRAIGIEASPSDPRELERAFEIATALGHGDEVAAMALERGHIESLEEDRLGDYLDAVLEIGEERGFEDATIGESLSPLARMRDLDAAVRATLLIVDRFVDERPLLVVPVVRVMAARLKNEGQGERSLALLDAVEPRLPLDALPAETRSTLINERGNALRELQRYEPALEAYRLAISIHPGDVEDADLQVALINEARTLRDLGLLQRSLDAFAEILPHTSGWQRFECLFGMVVTHQRAGDFLAAQSLIEEASEFAGSMPANDQIARFARAASFNGHYLGLGETVTALELYEAVENSDEVTARERFLALGAASLYALQTTSDDELRASTLEIARGLNPPALADGDPEMALAWLAVARLAGDEPLALRTVDALLANDPLPLIAMRAACIGADVSCGNDAWDDAARFIERAIEAAVSIAGTGSRGTSSLGVGETIGEVRRLGVTLSRAPAEPTYDALASKIADVQCSLLLALRLGEGGTAWEPEAAAGGQVLQWLDAGDAQVPVLTRTASGERECRRGSPLSTALAHGVGARVAGRVARSPALADDDLVDGVPAYRTFRAALAEVTGSLAIDPSQPLTVVPSASLLGIPLHHALPDLAIAYSPSFGVAATLSRRAAASPPSATAVAEVSCACFNDGRAIVEALEAGGEALADLCESRPGVGYHRIEKTRATAEATRRLLADADIVKLSCHGVAEATAGRFALVLSDGSQLPPPIADIGLREDLAARYLFDWGDLAAEAGRCRLVVSSACTSGSGLATGGGEQIGLARAFLASGVLSFVAPLWPVAAAPAQELTNTFIDACLTAPDRPLGETLRETRARLTHLPRRVLDAFVLHGHAGTVFHTHRRDTNE
jgi:tetratricopeptide (TPR) repeat protein